MCFAGFDGEDLPLLIIAGTFPAVVVHCHHDAGPHTFVTVEVFTFKEIADRDSRFNRESRIENRESRIRPGIDTGLMWSRRFFTFLCGAIVLVTGGFFLGLFFHSSNGDGLDGLDDSLMSVTKIHTGVRALMPKIEQSRNSEETPMSAIPMGGMNIDGVDGIGGIVGKLDSVNMTRLKGKYEGVSKSPSRSKYEGASKKKTGDEKKEAASYSTPICPTLTLTLTP